MPRRISHMEVKTRQKHLSSLLGLAVVVGVILTGCGSSGDATTLLRQTFTGPHTVNSGNITLSVGLTPQGSSTLKGPINLSFGGPFQSLGKGKLPASNFNIS